MFSLKVLPQLPFARLTDLWRNENQCLHVGSRHELRGTSTNELQVAEHKTPMWRANTARNHSGRVGAQHLPHAIHGDSGAQNLKQKALVGNEWQKWQERWGSSGTVITKEITVHRSRTLCSANFCRMPVHYYGGGCPQSLPSKTEKNTEKTKEPLKSSTVKLVLINVVLINNPS